MFEVWSRIEGARGFKAAGVHAGLKREGLLDFALIISEKLCVAAGVFTKNQVKAAPVLFNMQQLRQSSEYVRAVAINTISANACTGQQGYDNAVAMAKLVADEIGCAPEEVLVMSTGVIGTHLPMDKIANGVKLSSRALGDCWENAATAIMTTDTRPKLASVMVESSKGIYQIAGISKGAGMIAPNMATMLGILVTDVGMIASQAQQALARAADVSYNRIIIDGDTSTNDMVVSLANGASGVKLATEDDLAQFQMALDAVCVKLAQDIVRDGEGVSKFITLRVKSAYDDESARLIAHAIATSPLVKTAFYGCDANWGRIIAAAGRSGAPFDAECSKLWFASGGDAGDGLLLFAGGMPTDYEEDEAMAIMAQSSIDVTLDCGIGDGEVVIWTCDLSHEYVTINGDYRT